jgi:hypothetical protein
MAPGIRFGEAFAMEWTLAIVALTLLGVSAVSRRMTGMPVTPEMAMVFVGVGLLVGPQMIGGIDLESSSGTVRTLAEATLALVLFCDASRIDPRLLHTALGVPLHPLGQAPPMESAHTEMTRPRGPLVQLDAGESSSEVEPDRPVARGLRTDSPRHHHRCLYTTQRGPTNGAYSFV